MRLAEKNKGGEEEWNWRRKVKSRRREWQLLGNCSAKFTYEMVITRSSATLPLCFRCHAVSQTINVFLYFYKIIIRISTKLHNCRILNFLSKNLRCAWLESEIKRYQSYMKHGMWVPYSNYDLIRKYGNYEKL